MSDPHFQRSHEEFLAAERLRGELGVFCLKVVMTANAGVLVGLLAVIGNGVEDMRLTVRLDFWLSKPR